MPTTAPKLEKKFLSNTTSVVLVCAGVIGMSSFKLNIGPVSDPVLIVTR